MILSYIMHKFFSNFFLPQNVKWDSEQEKSKFSKAVSQSLFSMKLLLIVVKLHQLQGQPLWRCMCTSSLILAPCCWWKSCWLMWIMKPISWPSVLLFGKHLFYLGQFSCSFLANILHRCCPSISKTFSGAFAWVGWGELFVELVKEKGNHMIILGGKNKTCLKIWTFLKCSLWKLVNAESILS